MSRSCEYCATVPGRSDMACTSRDMALGCSWLTGRERKELRQEVPSYLLRKPTTTEERRALSAALPKCRCGNTISRANQERGLDLCVRCEDRQDERQRLADAINGAESLDELKVVLVEILTERL